VLKVVERKLVEAVIVEGLKEIVGTFGGTSGWSKRSGG
jgi:hypothetical protein